MPFFNNLRSGYIGGSPEDYYNTGIKSLHDYSSPNIIRDTLQVYVDASNKNSYPGSGTTWTDLSGNGRNGTLTLGPTFSTSEVDGYIQLDGVNDYISFGQTFNFTTQAFTIGMWLKFLSWNAGSGANCVLFWKGDFTTSGYYFEFNLSGGNGAFYTNQGGASQSSIGPAAATQKVLDNWMHLMITRSGTSVIIYINGIDVTSSSGSHTNPATASTNNFYLGAYTNTAGANITNMRIAMFYIWQKALSASDVLYTFNASRKRFGI